MVQRPPSLATARETDSTAVHDATGLNDPASTLPEFTVSELSGGAQAHDRGRLRPCAGARRDLRLRRHALHGHLYFDLKDEAPASTGVIWRSTAARMQLKPEDGMEVIATGRLTTYPGRSQIPDRRSRRWSPPALAR